jgi:hypothetical protein
MVGEVALWDTCRICCGLQVKQAGLTHGTWRDRLPRLRSALHALQRLCGSYRHRGCCKDALLSLPSGDGGGTALCHAENGRESELDLSPHGSFQFSFT